MKTTFQNRLIYFVTEPLSFVNVAPNYVSSLASPCLVSKAIFEMAGVIKNKNTALTWCFCLK